MRFESFAHLLRHQAETIGDGAAFYYGTDKTCCTYREFWQAVCRRSEELRTGGKTCLGILCDGSFACVREIFAANLAGLQVVLLDENTPEELLPQLLEYTDVDLIWGAEELETDLSGSLTSGVRDGAGKLLFFTSGTTQRAKAVVLTDCSLCASAYNGGAMLPLEREDILLCLLPLNHVFGFVCGLLWGLSCGAAVALGRGSRYYWADPEHFRPTAVSVVPALLQFLLKQACLNPELRVVLVGAGDCPPDLLGRVRDGGRQVAFGYGLTETSSGVAISTGTDPYAMKICPDDTITLAQDGEILIQAPTCMMQGYYKRAEATHSVLKDGVLSTGDLGWLDGDGALHLTGRKKEMLVLEDGTKLFLPEYEQEISRALDRSELAVLLSGDAPVLLVQGNESEREEILRRLRPVMAARSRGQQLRRILFTRDPLPRTASGKLKRWELQQKVGEL